MNLPLNHGKHTIIDDDDYERISQHKWRYKLSTGYAVRSVYDKGTRKITDVLLHRVINNTPAGYDTDHINRNRLDNRRINLETVTRQENTLRGVGPTALNSAKTHCIKGHEFDDENTYTTRTGKRACRECKRISWRAYYYRAKETS